MATLTISPERASLEELLKHSEMSLREATDRAGLNYKTVHSQFSKGVLSWHTIKSFSRYFGVSTDYFTGMSPLGLVDESGKSTNQLQPYLNRARRDIHRTGAPLSTDAILDWRRETGGDIRKFRNMLQHVDVFHPMTSESKVMRPYRMGEQSLATRWFQIKNEHDYLSKVSKFPREILDPTIQAHLSVQRAKGIRVDEIKIKLDLNDTHISQTYRRTMVAVHDGSGNALTLLYAQLL